MSEISILPQPIEIEVIASFRTRSQAIIVMSVDSSITEDNFLKSIFSELTVIELLDLYKLSVCQLTSDNVPFLPVILTTNGKFYFNPDINEDDETMKNYQLRNEYLKSLIKIPSKVMDE